MLNKYLVEAYSVQPVVIMVTAHNKIEAKEMVECGDFNSEDLVFRPCDDSYAVRSLNSVRLEPKKIKE